MASVHKKVLHKLLTFSKQKTLVAKTEKVHRNNDIILFSFRFVDGIITI